MWAFFDDLGGSLQGIFKAVAFKREHQVEISAKDLRRLRRGAHAADKPLSRPGVHPELFANLGENISEAVGEARSHPAIERSRAFIAGFKAVQSAALADAVFATLEPSPG